MPATEFMQTDVLYKGTSGQETRRQGFVESGWWVSIPLTIVPSHWLLRGEQRLDGEYYAAEAASALRIVDDSGYVIQPVKSLTEPIYYPGRFKRIYAKTQTDGIPFLTASEMLHFRPTSVEYLANNTSAINNCKVHPGWIMVTRSGTVGRCVIVSNRLAKFAVTDDALRVKVGLVPTGYLYAYLSTWIGQALISKDQYGSAIKHLEPHHLAEVPVPLLPEDEQYAIHEDIKRAYALRDEANDLLDKADELLHQELELPRFDESLVPYLPVPKQYNSGLSRPAIPHPHAFTINALELDGRFDASYHVPLVRTVVETLEQGKYPLVFLQELINDAFIPLRFKRVYVPKEYGFPFLQPSHLPYNKPFDLKYISKRVNARHTEDCLLQENWVLVTRSGTIGRVTLVTQYINGWVGSDDLIRIVTQKEQLHPGYLLAFLLTPYGNYQITREVYGAVIGHLEESHINAVSIPNAPPEVQAAIGAKVVSAYEKKDEASAIEGAAIKRLEALLEKRETKE